MPPCDDVFVPGVECVVTRFNPCFSGCRPATFDVVVEDSQDGVSILVLVDAALRRIEHWGLVDPLVGFNPCFSGCRPATISTHPTSSVSIPVSILVLVDAALRQYSDDFGAGIIP